MISTTSSVNQSIEDLLFLWYFLFPDVCWLVHHLRPFIASFKVWLIIPILDDIPMMNLFPSSQ